MGPILYMRGLHDGRLLLSALVVRPVADAAPELVADGKGVAAVLLTERRGWRAYHFTFDLPARPDASYRLDDDSYEVNAAFDGDLRIAFVSCNGQEWGDLKQPRAERNALWARLAGQHAERPFNLLLHGGDQIYADEIVDRVAPVRKWGRRALNGEPVCAGFGRITEQVGDALFERYVTLFSQPEFAWLAARVPSLAIWDDHDICDGWGSMSEAKLDSPAGRAVFDAARECFLIFQLGATTENLPKFCLDRSGASLSWHLALPGLHIIAPDLRSERRPRRVMGEHGWRGFRKATAAAEGGQVLVLSSVPALGPRLSWIEALLSLIPALQKYEDDLRDQWQSPSHRAEWQDFLLHLVALQERENTSVTALSGEIHLATRATLETSGGDLQQLVASGIAHPAPSSAYARGLGTLARFGKSPLPDSPIRLHPLPGRTAIYTAQRNYLVLERRDGRWCAWWELELDGPTPALELGPSGRAGASDGRGRPV